MFYLVGNILDNSFLRNVFNVGLVFNLWDIFSLVFNCIVINHFLLNWYIFSILLGLIFCFISFLRNVFNSWLSYKQYLEQFNFLTCCLLNRLLYISNRLLLYIRGSYRLLYIRGNNRLLYIRGSSYRLNKWRG